MSNRWCKRYQNHINNCDMTTCTAIEEHEHQYNCSSCYAWLVGA